MSNKNNKENISRQYIKGQINLQSKEDADVYDYVDNTTYYDHYNKNTNSLENGKNSDIDNKFKTRTLSESQERKLCIMKCTQNLGSKKLQQKLRSGGMDERNESTAICNDCKNLKSNTNLLKFKNDYITNSSIKPMNDDYFINILKQLINKLNTSNSLKSTYEDIPLQKSNEIFSMKNKFVKKEIKNNSSEDEWILRFEKIKGDQIMDRLNSSPENTYVNGKWVKNKLLSKCNDCKSIENDQRSEFNDTNESVLETVHDFKNPENQVIETNDDNLKNVNNLSTTSILEDKEILTTPLPGENDFVLSSNQTDKPEYLSSTPEDKLNYITSDDLWKYTSKDFKEKLNNDDIFLNNYTNNTNQDKTFEPTINKLQLNDSGSNEESISDFNNTLKMNNIEGNINDNLTNVLEGAAVASDTASDEEDNINCSGNKKVIKNILSSLMIKNITEIKTDTYIVPNESKSKKHKNSNKLLKKMFNTSKLENTTNNPEILTITNDKNYKSALLKNQIPYKNQSKNNPNDLLILNKLQKSRENKINRNTNNLFKKSSSNIKIPELKLKNERKINYNVKINNNDEIENKRILSVPKYLNQKNPREYIVKLKKENDNFVRNNFDEYENIANKNNFTSPNNKMLNKHIIPILSQNIPKLLKEHTRVVNNITKHTPRNIIIELKEATPVNLKTYIFRNLTNNKNVDDINETKRIPIITKKLSQVPIKSMNKFSSNNVSRTLGQFVDNNNDITTENPKNIDKKLEYNFQLNATAQTFANKDNMYNKNNLLSQKRSKSNTDFDSFNIRKPLSLIKNIKIPLSHKNNTYKKIGNLYVTNSSNEDINTNNRIIIKKLSLSPIQTSIMIPPDTITLNNNKISTTLKSKKSLNDIKKKSSNGLIKAKFLEISNEDDTYDNEHGPYKVEDLEPIIFDERIEKIIGPNKNHSSDHMGLKRLQSVPIIRPEYDDYYDSREYNKDEKKIVKQFNISYYDLINDDIMNFSKYDVKNHEGESINQSTFEIIPQVKVVDAVFNVPLVGHTHVDKNGSKYISDLYVPIEKSNNQQKAISLKELLNGNFHLVNEYDEHSLSMETPTPRKIESGFIECNPVDDSPDITRDKSYNIKTYKILQSSKENEKETAPIHVIQIINNGLCSDNIATKTTLKSKRAHAYKIRNADKRLSSIRLKNISNSKQKNKEFKDAYNHFDKDILDRFLQVYSPIGAV